jgi:hypothetical protein
MIVMTPNDKLPPQFGPRWAAWHRGEQAGRAA